MAIGQWQCLLWWLEIEADDTGELVRMERVFASEQERDAFLKERIVTGLVYDVVGMIESVWTEPEEIDLRLPAIEETEDNGFAVHAPIAQRTERSVSTTTVAGSSPARGSDELDELVE